MGRKRSARCLFIAYLLLCDPCLTSGVELPLERTFPKLRQLVVEGGFVQVRVEGEDRADLYVQGSIEEPGAEPSYEWQTDQRDERLKICIVAKKNKHLSSEGRLILRVPKQTQVKVSNSSGAISVSHLDSDQLSLRSLSGNIMLQDCHGQLKVSAGSGEINASQLAGQIRLRTSSGDLHLQQLKGVVACRSHSGPIEASYLQGTIEIKSTCGAITLEAVEGNLEVDTRSASIKVCALQPIAGARLHSVSGSIYLDLETGLDDYSVDLQSQTGRIVHGGQELGRRWCRMGSAVSIEALTASGSIHLLPRQ